eukprot:g1329.t1
MKDNTTTRFVFAAPRVLQRRGGTALPWRILWKNALLALAVLGLLACMCDGERGVFVSEGDEGNFASPYDEGSGLLWETYVKSIEIFNQGNQMHMRNEYDEAIALYRQAVKLNPNLGEAYLNMGNIFRGPEQLWAYEKAVEVSEKNPRLRADALANVGHYLVEGSGNDNNYVVIQRAVNLYKEAIALRPNHDAALYNLGIAYEKQGKRQLAYDTYMKVLKVLPDHYGANLNAGNLCMYAGLLNLSLAYHVKALNSPTLSTYYKIGLLNNMGQTLKMQFRIEKSI